jgi:Sec-independent protein secretion pathway component TatC
MIQITAMFLLLVGTALLFATPMALAVISIYGMITYEGLSQIVIIVFGIPYLYICFCMYREAWKTMNRKE